MNSFSYERKRTKVVIKQIYIKKERKGQTFSMTENEVVMEE